MKKYIVILIVLRIFFDGLPIHSLAAESWAKMYIDYVTENELWVSNGDFEPNKTITRGEVCAMLYRAVGAAKAEYQPSYDDVFPETNNATEIIGISQMGVMQGYEGYFRPQDSITREELAVVLERVYRMMSDEITEHEVNPNRLLDFNEISEYAQQSVMNMVENSIFTGVGQRCFAPKRQVTRAEMAKLVSKIHQSKIKVKRFTTEKVSISNPQTAYEVYQEGVVKQFVGVAGFGLVARFPGSPGTIYVSRTTNKPVTEIQMGNPAPPVTFARVIDPSGNAVARCDLDYMENGKMEQLIHLPAGEAGIYQIQIINGRDGDLVSIGVNGCSAWGVRGEFSFCYTQTTPKEGYIYTPRTFRNLSAAANGGTFSLNTAEGEPVINSSAISRYGMTQGIECSTLQPDSVYMLKMSAGFRGQFAINGVSKIICPTAAMARDLRGNYSEYDGFLFMGPLQARAREQMMKIYERAGGDFTVQINRPEEMPEVVNPLAEVGIVSVYDGFIAAMGYNLQDQCLDPANPFFGAHVGRDVVNGQKAYHTNTWQSYDFDQNYLITPKAYAGAVATDSQLNYYYGNQALIDRISLSYLQAVSVLSEEGCYVYDNGANNSAGGYPWVHSNFRMAPWAEAFYLVKNMLDAETREIVQEGMEIMADKHMVFRGSGATNQWGHGIKLSLYMHMITGEERYHESFKRQIKAYEDPTVWPEYIGQTAAGYCLEGYGCDGSYQYMNETNIAEFYTRYRELPDQDPETMEILSRSAQRMLEFESKFHMPTPKGLSFSPSPNHFAARTASSLGYTGGDLGYTLLIGSHPLARRMWEVIPSPDEYNSDQTFAFGEAHKVNTNEWALNTLHEMWKKYEFTHDYSANRAGNLAYTYELYQKPLPEAEPLPCENETSRVWDSPGIMALKHKGIYVTSFYATALPSNNVPEKSWMGGGPTIIWDAKAGKTVVSTKHGSYDKPAAMTASHVNSSCIYGINSAGNLFVSGKERASLQWIEEGKSFEIKGVAAGSAKQVSWRYDLTDEGVNITPSISPMGGGEEYFVNLPIARQKNPEYTVSHTKGALRIEYDGSATVYEWDPSFESTYLEAQNDSDRITRLRIKLKPDKALTIKLRVANFKLLSSRPSDTACNIRTDTRQLQLNFSAEVDTDSLDAVTVTAGAQELTAGVDYTLLTQGKQLFINFHDDLLFQTDYQILFGGLSDLEGRRLVMDNTSVSFRTEFPSDIRVVNFCLTKDIVAAVTEPLQFAAENNLQGAILQLENQSLEAKNVVLIFAKYQSLNSEKEYLGDVASISKEIPARSVIQIGIGEFFAENIHGGHVKLFVWENYSGLLPLLDSYSLNLLGKR